MVAFLIHLGLLLLSTALADDDFGYEGALGPSEWPKKFQTCVGKYQSPINIDEYYVRNITFPPLKFAGLGIPRSSFLTNNGHTVMLRANESEAAMISGGPLNETYIFEQLHFHWGKNDKEGSEDLINNHSFAMELHAVFYKKSYDSINEAVKYPDGLAVLAYFYEASNDSNPTYEPIVDVLPTAQAVGAKNALQEPLLLSKLLAPNLASTQDYFTYAGSLTTPPCLEVVTWIDFVVPQVVSHDQLAAFRTVQAVDGKKLTHNFRPIQPLDGRIIYHNVASGEGPEEKPNEETQKPPGASKNSGMQAEQESRPNKGKKNGQGNLNSSICHLVFTTVFGAIVYVAHQ